MRDHTKLRAGVETHCMRLSMPTGTHTPSCIANRRRETAPTVACFKLPKA